MDLQEELKYVEDQIRKFENIDKKEIASMCENKNTIYYKPWQLRNPEKKKENDKTRYIKNKEKIIRRSKEYYAKNKEKINKWHRENYYKRKEQGFDTMI